MHIRMAMREVSSWNMHAQIIGLYVNDKREIEKEKMTKRVLTALREHNASL
jgi:hypothetical protein